MPTVYQGATSSIAGLPISFLINTLLDSSLPARLGCDSISHSKAAIRRQQNPSGSVFAIQVFDPWAFGPINAAPFVEPYDAAAISAKAISEWGAALLVPP